MTLHCIEEGSRTRFLVLNIASAVNMVCLGVSYWTFSCFCIGCHWH